MLVIDFETRCRAPLPLCGAHKYAADPSLDMLCLGWSLNGEFGVVKSFDDLPISVLSYIRHTKGLVAAWNAEFDRCVWNALAPDDLQLPTNRWYCLAAQARVNALPGALGDCTKALFGVNTKDVRGAQLIKLLSIPQENGEFLEDAGLLEEMCEYCLTDVEESVHCMEAMRMMTLQEHAHWLDTVEVNDNGVRIDRRFAVAATAYAEDEAKELAADLNEITEGEVQKHTQIARIKKWLEPRLPDASVPLMTVYKKGEAKQSFDKSVRQRLLVADDEHVITLDPDVREVIEIVDDGNKSSVAKYKRMIERAEDDDRIRGAFVFAGASQTLRFASRGLQLHNFTRDCVSVEDMAKLRTDVLTGAAIANPMKTLARALRPTLIPDPGNVFVVGDWSGIEACALPWLTNDVRADKRLNIMKDPDRDLYTITAKELGFTEEERQIGKVAELALGYGGAAGALGTMAQAFGLILNEHEKKKIVDRWREVNGWAVTFWAALERAAWAAIARPGREVKAGRVSYTFHAGLIGGTLVCTLPGGHMIQYPRAKLEQQETPFGTKPVITALKANWKPAAGEKTWPRVTLWRGLLAENVTQALCGALLRTVVNDLLDNDWPVVAHVHDEIVEEVEAEEADDAAQVLQEIMEDNPSWAQGLPLIAEPKIMTRYGK